MTGIGAVIMDANALLAPGRSGVDVYDEVERVVGAADLLVPEAVHRELRGLATDNPDAELALDMVDEHCTVVDDESGGETPADDVIVALARDRDGVAVATNDAALRDRLHGADVPVLFLRQERHVEISYP